MSIQKELVKHLVNAKSSFSYWKGQPNERVFMLGNKALGDLGENFVAAYFSGTKENDNRGGFDVKAGQMLIEVKTARKSFSDTNVEYSWNQIRLDKNHTHLALLAISPDDSWLYLLDKDSIQSLINDKKLLFQHSNESRQLKLSKKNFPKYMTDCEKKSP